MTRSAATSTARRPPAAARRTPCRRRRAARPRSRCRSAARPRPPPRPPPGSGRASSARRHQRLDAMLRPDVDRDRLAAIVEGGPAHRRRPRRQQPLERGPIPELHHPAAHQRVGRERVGPRRVAIDQQHPRPAAGQQHRGRRPCRTGADDHNIIGGCDAHAGSRGERCAERPGDADSECLGVATDARRSGSSAAGTETASRAHRAGGGGYAAAMRDRRRRRRAPAASATDTPAQSRSPRPRLRMPSASRSRLRSSLTGCSGLSQAAGSAGAAIPDAAIATSIRLRHPAEPRIRGGAVLGEIRPEHQPRPVDALHPPGDPHPLRRQPREIQPPAARELHRRLPPGGGDVRDPPPALAGDPGQLQPGEDVAAAITPHHPHVPADRQRHRPPRARGFPGRAAARSTSRPPPARRRRAGPPAAGRRGRELRDPRRQRRGEAGTRGRPQAPVATTTARGQPAAGLGLDAVAVAAAAAPDRRAADTGARERRA